MTTIPLLLLHTSGIISIEVFCAYVVCLILGIVALAVAIWREGRAERDWLNVERAEVANRLGLELVPKPISSQKKAVFERVSHVKLFRGMADGIQWFMSGKLAGFDTLVVNHVYVISTGHSAHRVVSTLTGAECPHDWPSVSLTPSHTPTFDRIPGFLRVRRLFNKPLALESDALAQRWNVHTESEDFALCLLTPTVQAWLLKQPAFSWHIGRGMVCCTCSGDATTNLDVFALLPHRFLDLASTALQNQV